MSTSELRSPFVERVISLLPRGHEEALKQAFYNVAAICLFLIMSAAAMAVYFILEPFVKPLLWAVLIGSVLHPFKHKSVFVARGWLEQLKDEDTLLALGLLSIPLKLLDMMTEWIGRTFVTHLKVILSLIAGIYFTSTFQQYYDLCDIISLFDYAIDVLEPMTQLNPFHPTVGTCLIGLFGLAISLIAQCKSSITAHLGWILVFALGLVLLGSLSFLVIPFLLFLSAVAVAISLGWLEEDNDTSSVSDDNDEPPVNEPSVINVSTPKFPHSIHRLMRSRIVTAALSSFSTPLAAPQPTVVVTQKTQSSSNRFISHALWACIAVNLWKHMWLINLFPVPLVIFLVKSLGSYFHVWTFLKTHLTNLVTCIYDWLNLRKEQLFPKPLQWMYRAAVFLDRMVIRRLVDQTDAVVTVVIIFIGLLLTISVSVFTAVQIYGESVHLLKVGTRLVNRTLHDPEARQWLPQGADRMVDLGSVVDNAYSYGKTSIATFVKNAINEKDPARAAQIERAVLEGLDRVQRAWLSQGDSTSGDTKPTIDAAPSHNSSTLFKPPLLRRLTQDVFNVTVLVNYGKENIGSMLSILESVWTIMKGNLSLVFKSTTAVLSILLVGGTAILNFLVNGVVFLTALYYLLVASELQYKPIQLMSFFSPGGGNTLGTAMEEAINTVCLASLKLAAFYGIWTWIIHTIFGVSFVVIPVALAAVLGAVPFLGTYWAALPAVLDLWLAQSRGLEAVLLIMFQFAPTLIVDASFYAEIKGGGHPYLTGLAVAGGIFWLGVEGAIIGPLLLCILLVGVSIYSSLVQPDIPPPAVEMSQPRWIHRRLLRTDTVG